MALKEYGWQLLGGSGVLTALGAWLLSRIRVKEAAETQSIRDHAAPLDVIRQQLNAAQAQTAQAQSHLYEFVQASMQRQDAQTRALLAVEATLTTQGEALRQHMADSSRRAEKIYDKLSSLDNRMAGIQGHLGAS